MPYTTQADLEDRFGTELLVNLTDRGGAGAIDTDVLDRAIADTDALINGFVAGRYVLPFASVPDPIPALARAITIYNLHVYEPNPKIAKDYNDAMTALRDIAKGTIQLTAQGVTPEGTGAGGAQVTDRDRDFTAETMKGFI
ncbi:gp436 family protein [Sagittula sp. S175]|uniref:gp436 family protein n=1 Tax=Sagittula sp. S175 TaxID=3415129 RepID=UPI003C7E7F3F